MVVVKTVRQWQEQVSDWARRKGWWDKDLTPLEAHMLIVTEIAEASEAVRNGIPDDGPHSEPKEIAGAVIRILDYCGRRGWDLQHYLEIEMKRNEGRERRHGGKAI